MPSPKETAITFVTYTAASLVAAGIFHWLGIPIDVTDDNKLNFEFVTLNPKGSLLAGFTIGAVSAALDIPRTKKW